MQTASSAPRKGALTRALSAPGTANGLILLGAVLQVLFFILYLINGDVHVDEAMLVLNARSLAREGTDIFGQRMPVYFDTWLYGGQSSLATYLAAAFIRLFGNQIWIARLPLALTAFAGLFALKGLVRLLFPGQYTVQNTVLLLTAIEPWRLYQSAWTLDCAYLPFVLLFALYFLVHAVEKPKARLLFYTLSMACFALGLYAYMAAAILIPVLLVILYLSLLIKKKMKFRYALWSVAILAVCALPFLLLGLVQAGLLKDCNFLGLSITAMDSYARGNSTTIFGSAGTAGAVFQRAFSNLGGVLYNILVPDLMLLQSARYPTLSGNVSNYPFGHTGSAAVFVAQEAPQGRYGLCQSHHRPCGDRQLFRRLFGVRHCGQLRLQRHVPLRSLLSAAAYFGRLWGVLAAGELFLPGGAPPAGRAGRRVPGTHRLCLWQLCHPQQCPVRQKL